MTSLTVPEQDLLQRIGNKPELRLLFFRQAEGFKWFDALQDEGYLDPNKIPGQIPSEREGYVRFPDWHVLDYILKSSSIFRSEPDSDYIPKVIKLLVEATEFARQQKLSNYRVWWKFAEIVSLVPTKYITQDIISAIDYWVSDKFETGLVISEIGEKWLHSLLEENSEASQNVACSIVKILYKVDLIEKQSEGEKAKYSASMRMDAHHAKKIINDLAITIGEKLGQPAIDIIHDNLETTLSHLKNDDWSAVWQPAIEDHDQNKYRDDPENILVATYRSFLEGLFRADSKLAISHSEKLLDSPYKTFRRLAIYLISQKSLDRIPFYEKIITPSFFTSNYRHELWHFLQNHYVSLNKELKNKVIEIINSKEILDDDGNILKEATAYEHAIWLSSIKQSGSSEKEQYDRNVEIAGSSPSNPDFSSHISTRWGGSKSPYTLDELSTFSTDKLIEKMNSFEATGRWADPGIDGLRNALRDLIKSAPTKYFKKLPKMNNLKSTFIPIVISAYQDLWNEEATLPWDNVWSYLLNYCEAIITNDSFWQTPDEYEHSFDAWTVTSIAKLIISGVKSDDHAFDPSLNLQAEKITHILLERLPGEKFDDLSDAVSKAINGARGQSLEALINLALRSCRLEHKVNGDHVKTWEKYKPYFDEELTRKNNEEYEFSTLVTYYLPNFLYMDKKWTISNLSSIFDFNNHLSWLCALKGYSYTSTVYQEVFDFLNTEKVYHRAIEDNSLSPDVKKRIVQHAFIAYLNDFVELDSEDNIILQLILDREYDLLFDLVWFIWSLNKEDNEKLKTKVFELWPLIIEHLQPRIENEKELASRLCYWIDFIDVLDDVNIDYLITIAPFADFSQGAYQLLKGMARLSQNQPLEIYKVWSLLLENSAPDYPSEAIEETLINLVNEGPDGTRFARDIVSEYLKKGVGRPYDLLKEIIG